MSFLARKDNSKIFNFSLKKVLNSLGRKFWIIWNIWNEFRQSRDNSGNVVAGKKRILVKKEDLPSLLDSKLLLKSVHFKKTVAQSSFLSKVLSFLLKSKQCQRKWQHFWKKWGFRNCLLKLNGLYGKFLFIELGETTKVFFPTWVMLESDWTSLILKKQKYFKSSTYFYKMSNIRFVQSGSNLAQFTKKRISSS